MVQRVLAGESIDITEHGHPIARIVPLRPGPLEQLCMDGRATPADGDLLDALEELGLPAPVGEGSSPSEALEALRAERD